MSLKNPVKTLNPEVARKIAAGEVIDRPCAIVRELLDNAIDSGADKITVEIRQGGIEKIRVIDNGSGMTETDLENCARPHSTSKISSENDLLNLSTLGFRGEALASIAAVSRLQIISGGFKMKASITEDHIIEKTAQNEGTIVQSEGLFENFPARRNFLKRASSEGVMCKNTFIEKSLPFPEKAFRFINNGEIKIDLQKGESLKERFVKAMELTENPSLFNEINFFDNTKDFSFKIVIGEPSVYRSNKKDIYIFVNGRKIQEFSLVQAIEYGGQGFFPNGTFPVASLFVKINPNLVDFNIHPAKKEARFKDISQLHHEISTSVRNFFKEYTNQKLNNLSQKPLEKPQELFNFSKTDFSTFSTDFKNNFSSIEERPFSNLKKYQEQKDFSKTEPKSENQNISGYQKFVQEFQKKHPEYSAKHENENFNSEQNLKSTKVQEISSFIDRTLSLYTKKQNLTNEQTEQILPQKENLTLSENEPKFVGTCLGTFIIEEFNDSLYIIDKHAAHERILFNQIMQNQGKSQNLLIPETFITESETDDEYLFSVKNELEKLGFKICQEQKGVWKIYTINERFSDTIENFVSSLLTKKIAPSEIIYSIAATTACKAAIKDGGFLDDQTAHNLAKEALKLPDPHCPHGRPIFTVISREMLFSLVKRT